MNFDQIYDEYYNKILNFCFRSLKNRQLAEDCTQEVFLAFLNKMHKLRLDTNVAAWLYTAAKFEIKLCISRNKNNIPIDEIGEIGVNDFEETGKLSELLTDEEYEMLIEYFVKGEDVNIMASKRKISVAALYQRINRLKNRIKKKM